MDTAGLSTCSHWPAPCLSESHERSICLAKDLAAGQTTTPAAMGECSLTCKQSPNECGITKNLQAVSVLINWCCCETNMSLCEYLCSCLSSSNAWEWTTASVSRLVAEDVLHSSTITLINLQNLMG